MVGVFVIKLLICVCKFIKIGGVFFGKLLLEILLIFVVVLVIVKLRLGLDVNFNWGVRVFIYMGLLFKCFLK